MPLLVFLIKTNRVKFSILEAYRSFHIRQRLCWHIRGCFPGEGNYKDCTACHRICKRRFDMKLLLDRDWHILHEWTVHLRHPGQTPVVHCFLHCSFCSMHFQDQPKPLYCNRYMKNIQMIIHDKAIVSILFYIRYCKHTNYIWVNHSEKHIYNEDLKLIFFGNGPWDFFST